MLSPTEKLRIKTKILKQEYEDIQALFDELPAATWGLIWKSPPHKKMADPDNMILRDILRTSQYFGVELEDVGRLMPGWT